jgi:hypothetical protein
MLAVAAFLLRLDVGPGDRAQAPRARRSRRRRIWAVEPAGATVRRVPLKQLVFAGVFAILVVIAPGAIGIGIGGGACGSSRPPPACAAGSAGRHSGCTPKAAVGPSSGPRDFAV